MTEFNSCLLDQIKDLEEEQDTLKLNVDNLIGYSIDLISDIDRLQNPTASSTVDQNEYTIILKSPLLSSNFLFNKIDINGTVTDYQNNTSKIKLRLGNTNIVLYSTTSNYRLLGRTNGITNTTTPLTVNFGGLSGTSTITTGKDNIIEMRGSIIRIHDPYSDITGSYYYLKYYSSVKINNQETHTPTNTSSFIITMRPNVTVNANFVSSSVTISTQGTNAYGNEIVFRTSNNLIGKTKLKEGYNDIVLSPTIFNLKFKLGTSYLTIGNLKIQRITTRSDGTQRIQEIEILSSNTEDIYLPSRLYQYYINY